MSTASQAGRSRRVRVSRTKNPDGQMPLGDHLRELRNRLIIAGIGLLLGAIVGFIIYQPFFSALIDPVHRLSDEGRIVTVAWSASSSSGSAQWKTALALAMETPVGKG